MIFDLRSKPATEDKLLIEEGLSFLRSLVKPEEEDVLNDLRGAIEELCGFVTLVASSL